MYVNERIRPMIAIGKVWFKST